MKAKTFSIGVFGFLALALMVSFASAAIVNSVDKPSPYGSTFNVSLSNSTLGETVNIAVGSITDGTNTITFDSLMGVALGPSTSVPITYHTNNFDFNYAKTYSTTMNITNGTSGYLTQATVTFAQRSYCDNMTNYGNALNTEITNVKILNGFGDGDSYWYPMDQVQAEVTVDNQGNYPVKSIEVDWALYTTAGDKISDGKLSTFRLKDGNDKVLTFNITLDKHIKEFEGENAILLVKAKGKIDSSDAGTHNNEEVCSADSNYQTNPIEVITSDDFVVLKNILLNSEQLNTDLSLNSTLTCGQDVTVNADVWNIQANDQTDVYVEIYNKELGIDKTVSIGDINSFSSESMNSVFTIPNTATEKWYSVLFTIYDQDNNVFENSENGIAEFSVKVLVANCTAKWVPSISAQLGSSAVAGKNLIINTVVTNPGTSTITYTLNAAGYADWATLVNMSATTITLAPGQSQTVQLTFLPNKNSAGDRFFNFEVVANNQLVASQPVAVTIGASKSSGIGNFIASNWKLLGIILLNLILVIAIIIVIVRLYRR